MHKHLSTATDEKRPCECEFCGWKGGKDEDEAEAAQSPFEGLIIIFSSIKSAVLCFFFECLYLHDSA